jgi:uncharacterized protein YbaP (TraB family)
MYLSVDRSNVRIAGTMHFFPAESPNVPDWLWEAYNWAAKLVVESHGSSWTPYLQLPEGSCLSDHIPKPLFDALTVLYKEPPSAIERLKPWTAFLRTPWYLMPLVPGVEIQIEQQAGLDGKPMRTLESPAEVSRMFDAIPAQVFAATLERMLRDVVAARVAIQTMHSTWLSRSIPALFAFAPTLPMWSTPALRVPLVDIRNENWIPRLRQEVSSSRRTLVLVGALHLCGNESVVNLLEREGYRLEPIL